MSPGTSELKQSNYYFFALKQPPLNSLAPGRFKVNFRWVIFKLILVVIGWGISCETALIWVSLDHTYVKSTLVQVMAWCRQATSHYLSQCWPRSPSSYGVTRPQWVNSSLLEQNGYFADDISKCIFINESFVFWFTEVSLKFVPNGLIDNKSVLVLGSGNGLAPTRRQDIIWTNTGPVHWSIYEALGGEELKLSCMASYCVFFVKVEYENDILNRFIDTLV